MTGGFVGRVVAGIVDGEPLVEGLGPTVDVVPSPTGLPHADKAIPATSNTAIDLGVILDMALCLSLAGRVQP